MNHGLGTQILPDLHLQRIRVRTSHSCKVAGLEGFGIEIVEQVSVSASRKVISRWVGYPYPLPLRVLVFVSFWDFLRRTELSVSKTEY